jgi:hypothetical protein
MPDRRSPMARGRVRNLTQCRKSPMLEEFSRALMPLVLANLNCIGYDDDIPMLYDDDPVYWDNVGAEVADALAAAAIARAALQTKKEKPCTKN